MADLTRVLYGKAIELGRLAIRATTAAGSGHPTTALSLAHLVARQTSETVWPENLSNMLGFKIL